MSPSTLEPAPLLLSPSKSQCVSNWGVECVGIFKGGFLYVFDTVFSSPSMRVKMGGVRLCIGNRQLRVLLHVLNPVVPSSSPKSQCVSGVGLSPLRGSEGGVFLVGGSCLESVASCQHCWNIE